MTKNETKAMRRRRSFKGCLIVKYGKDGLPEVVADSVAEMSQLTGMPLGTIRSDICHYPHRWAVVSLGEEESD